MLFGIIKLETDPTKVSAAFTHDHGLVGLSLIMALAASLTFLEIAAHARDRIGAQGLAWRCVAGAILGIGVWATHMIGVLAMETPLLQEHQIAPNLASFVVAIATGVCAMVIAVSRFRLWRLALAGLIVGIGGVVMHYWGVLGVALEGVISFRAPWAIATGIGAFATSIVAVVVALARLTPLLRIAFAFPMAAAIAGLHYMDMSAIVISPEPTFRPLAPPPSPTGPALALFAGGIALCGLAALVLRWDRRRIAASPAHQSSNDPDHNIITIPDQPPRQ